MPADLQSIAFIPDCFTSDSIIATNSNHKSISKIALTIILILVGAGAIGITIGYLAAYISASFLLFFILVTTLKPLKQISTVNLYCAFKKILFAGVASWVPLVIAIIGARLGTVIVFGIEGASQAAFYFIAFLFTTQLRP